MKGEIRQDKATKEWVIYAPARGKRPSDFQRLTRPKRRRPEHVDTCPFCTGNEHMLPSIITEHAALNHGGWQTRVVPNLFPVLTPEGSVTRKVEGIYIAMQGFGYHEVIIDSPRHNQDIPKMKQAHVRALIDTYHARYTELSADERNQLILIFKNHGPRAGASIEHPHSQLVAAGIIPRRIRWRNLEAQRYYDEWGRCVYCDILEFEQQDSRRVVFESDSFLAFVPYAAEVPFEVWILPRRHHPSFGRITENEKTDLANALSTVLNRMARQLNYPDYNYVIYSSTRYGNAPHLHWYLRIQPRLITRAGFELGSGMRINPSLPEVDAAFLKETA